MNGPSFMVIAGEPSGDALGAQLVSELRRALAHLPFAPTFWGAGGPRLAGAGVALDLDLTRHAVTGLGDVLRNLPKFRRFFRQLLDLAFARQPDVIVMIDFQAFHRRFARALRRGVRRHQREFFNWRPRLVQFVSPQVWGSRPERAYDLAADVDLLLCLFAFEKDWYARRTPGLQVEAVGHPLLDRYQRELGRPTAALSTSPPADPRPLVLLLPGSREGELRRHLPVMIEAARLISARHEVRFHLVVPDDRLKPLAEGALHGGPPGIGVEVGNLAARLREAAVAIASTGTVTLECALFRVPTVALYITSPLTFFIGKQMATVESLAMPNILAGTRVMPEFLQSDATPGRLAEAASNFLRHPSIREAYRRKLDEVVAQLGAPGAARRAALAIARLAGLANDQ
jgi:lipid-A-disaccharide synthase